MPRVRTIRTRSQSSVGVFHQLRTTESRFKQSCQQIVLLNQRLDDLQLRYCRAVTAEQRSFRYSLRLSMAVLEGIRNMYYEYACRKADELTELRCQVYGPNGEDDEADAANDNEYDTSGDDSNQEGDPS